MKTKIILLILILSIIACDQSQEKRKIKLAEQSPVMQRNERFTSTIHLEPTLRRAIAIMFFENKTGDQNLEWLQKGLTEMLIRSLSQSSSLSVLSTDRIFEILNQLEKSPQTLDMDLAAVVAQEANVEAVLSGNISKHGDSLRINVKVIEPNQGKILKEESVEGKGLDAIFGMVDDLSQKIKNVLALSLGKQEILHRIGDMSTNSLEAWRHYIAGIDFRQQAMFNDAIAEFKKAIEADPGFVTAYYQMCLLMMIQGDRQKAQDYFDNLIILREKATPREKYQIDRLEGFFNRDLRKMIDASKRWLKENPNDIEASFDLGDIYFGTQNYDDALYYYKSILAIDSTYKAAYNMVGYCYARKGDLANAVAAMDKYKETAPNEPNPLDSMGEIYYNFGDYKNAEKNLKQSIQINENFSPSWFRLSDVYLDQGDNKKALQIIEQYIKKATDPVSKANGYMQIGFIQWNLGKIDDAIDYFQKFVENQIASYRAATWVNELFLEKGDSAAAKASLQKNYDFIRDSLLVREPIRIRDLANFSLWYDVNADQSIEIIRRALKTSNGQDIQKWGYFYLAMLYLKTNNFDEYKKISENFTSEFTELMNDNREAPFARETWKTFLFLNLYGRQNKDQGIEKYSQLIKYCQDHELIVPEMIFRLFLVDLYSYNDEREKANAQLRIIGSPEEEKWMVIAPFDNTNGFQKRYPPERKINLHKTYNDRKIKLTWQHPNDGFDEGYINFKQIYQKYNWSVAYGVIYVKSPNRREAQIRMGTNDSVKLWLNDKEVWRMNIGRDAVFDSDIANVVLEPGLNKILIKVCNRINEWGFYFRVTDKSGEGFGDIEFVSADRIEH